MYNLPSDICDICENLRQSSTLSRKSNESRALLSLSVIEGALVK